MIKRGFVGGWQNRHWQWSKTALQGGAENPDVPPDGTGIIPDYMTNQYKGEGTHFQWINDELVTWLGEVAFLSPLMQYLDGKYYRFIVQYRKASRTSNACSCTMGIAWTSEDGRMTPEAGSQWVKWDSSVSSRNGEVLGIRFFYGESKYSWDVVTSKCPQFTDDFYNLMMNNANAFLYENLPKTSGLSNRTTLMNWIEGVSAYGKEPLTFEAITGSTSDIVRKAMELSGYKYWYGGDGRVATAGFANSLRASYPSIWTQVYYNRALADIGTRVADCSYLCNYAYGKASPGNHGPGTGSYAGIYSRWNGAPKNGMICWRQGHCGIYNNGTTIEMANQNEDFVIKPYSASRWQAIFYDKNRNY